MSKNLQIKDFKKGFGLGTVLFLIFQAVTLLDFLIMTIGNSGGSIIVHRWWDFGFPFSMSSSMYGVFPGNTDFLGFSLNIIFAIIFSLSLGLVFKYTNSLRDLIKSRFFIIGFLVGISLLICLNVFSYVQNQDVRCSDCMEFYGFPFTFVGHGGFVTHTLISWYALSKNILVLLVIGFYIGFFVNLIQTKLSAKNLK